MALVNWMQVTGAGKRWEFRCEGTILPVWVEKREMQCPADSAGAAGAGAGEECAGLSR
jgi:hypothetical protein